MVLKTKAQTPGVDDLVEEDVDFKSQVNWK